MSSLFCDTTKNENNKYLCWLEEQQIAWCVIKEKTNNTYTVHDQVLFPLSSSLSNESWGSFYHYFIFVHSLLHYVVDSLWRPLFIGWKTWRFSTHQQIYFMYFKHNIEVWGIQIQNKSHKFKYKFEWSGRYRLITNHMPTSFFQVSKPVIASQWTIYTLTKKRDSNLHATQTLIEQMCLSLVERRNKSSIFCLFVLSEQEIFFEQIPISINFGPCSKNRLMIWMM